MQEHCWGWQTLIFNRTTRCWEERNYIVLLPFQSVKKQFLWTPSGIISLMYDCVVVRSNALGLSGMPCWSKCPYISDRVQRLRVWSWEHGAEHCGASRVKLAEICSALHRSGRAGVGHGFSTGQLHFHCSGGVCCSTSGHKQSHINTHAHSLA